MQNENLLDGLRINDFVKLLTLILTIYYTGIMFKKISRECFIFARPTWSARTKTLLYAWIHDILTSVDTNVTVGIEISGMENLESVSSIEIISESGRDVNIYSVRERGAGRHHNFFRQEISVPRQVGHNPSA